MNKRIINLFVALVFVAANTFAANVTTITKVDAKSLILDTKNWKSENISIVIKDVAGSIIFQDEFSTENGKKFNFEKLPVGRYSIILSDNLKSTTQVFNIDAEKVSMQPEIVTTYKPVININGSFIDLNYMASADQTTVSIYDENDTVYKLKIKDEKSISRRFDTSVLPSGNYTFNVTNKNGSYSKTFTK